MMQLRWRDFVFLLIFLGACKAPRSERTFLKKGTSLDESSLVSPSSSRQTTGPELSSVEGLADSESIAASGQVATEGIDSSSSLSINHSNWMEAIFSKRPATNLNSVLMAGTHNSGTYKISSASQRAPKESIIYDQPGISSIVAGWSRCQNQSLTQQLRDGIRYLDLRISFDDDNQGLIVHGLTSIGLKEAIGEIKAFTDEHPKEIVLISARLDHAYRSDLSSGKRMSKLNDVYKQFTTILGKTLLVTEGLDFTFESLWSDGVSVVLLKDFSAEWFDKTDKEALYDAATKFLKSRQSEQLYAMDLILTPDVDAIIKQLTGIEIIDDTIGYVKDIGEGIYDLGVDAVDSLRDLFLVDNSSHRLYVFEKGVLDKLPAWIEGWHEKGYPLNIMTTDFYDQSSFVDVIIELNRKKFPD